MEYDYRGRDPGRRVPRAGAGALQSSPASRTLNRPPRRSMQQLPAHQTPRTTGSRGPYDPYAGPDEDFEFDQHPPLDVEMKFEHSPPTYPVDAEVHREPRLTGFLNQAQQTLQQIQASERRLQANLQQIEMSMENSNRDCLVKIEAVEEMFRAAMADINRKVDKNNRDVINRLDRIARENANRTNPDMSSHLKDFSTMLEKNNQSMKDALGKVLSGVNGVDPTAFASEFVFD